MIEFCVGVWSSTPDWIMPSPCRGLITGNEPIDELPIKGMVPLKPMVGMPLSVLEIVCPPELTPANAVVELAELSYNGAVGMSVQIDPRCELSTARFRNMIPSMPSAMEVYVTHSRRSHIISYQHLRLLVVLHLDRVEKPVIHVRHRLRKPLCFTTNTGQPLHVRTAAGYSACANGLPPVPTPASTPVCSCEVAGTTAGCCEPGPSADTPSFRPLRSACRCRAAAPSSTPSAGRTRRLSAAAPHSPRRPSSACRRTAQDTPRRANTSVGRRSARDGRLGAPGR